MSDRGEQAVESPRRRRQGPPGRLHDADPAHHPRRLEAADDEGPTTENGQGQRRQGRDPETGGHERTRRRQVRHLEPWPHGQPGLRAGRVREGTHAGAPRHRDERLLGELAPDMDPILDERAVGRTDGDEVVLDQGPEGQAAGAVQRSGRETEIGPALEHGGQNPVGQGVDDRDLDLGVQGHEPCHDLRQQARRDRRQAGERHPPAPGREVGVELGQRRRRLVQDAIGEVPQGLALRGKRHVARVAVEQARAELVLDPGDQPAEGRARQTRAPRRPPGSCAARRAGRTPAARTGRH